MLRQLLLDYLHRFCGRSDITINGDTYMRRWRRLSMRLGGIRLHHFRRGDYDRECHDHPFSFVSLIVRGGYREERLDGTSRVYRAPALLFRRAEEFHRVDLLDGRETWTIVLHGPNRRRWGFMTPEGWKGWQAFTEWKLGGAKPSLPSKYSAKSSY